MTTRPLELVRVALGPRGTAETANRA